MSAWSLGYAGYWIWMLAGFCDFLLHRRERLPVTSGLAESTMHLAQLAVCGTGVLMWLYLEPSTTLLVCSTVLAIAHAALGYLDTVVAFPRRRIGPVEQHVHSVLDMAPWVAVLAFVTLYHDAPGVGFQRRLPTPSPSVQLALLMPPLFLTLGPAMLEFFACLRAAAPATDQRR